MLQREPMAMPEAHLAAARVQARAINTFTFVLALGGLVRPRLGNAFPIPPASNPSLDVA